MNIKVYGSSLMKAVQALATLVLLSLMPMQNAKAHKTHLTADKGPRLDCIDCHSDPFQFFPAVFKDGELLAFTTVCDTCHSPGGDYDGIDDPAGLQGATIASLTIHVTARYLEGPWPNALPYAAGVDVGYQTGTATRWSGSQLTDTSGGYHLISSRSYTTDSDGGPLDLNDINNLQITLRRQVAGSYLLRVTEVRVEVAYSF